MDPLPEPWMRGPIAAVDPLLAPVLYSFQQAREDLRRWLAINEIGDEQLCQKLRFTFTAILPRACEG
jgi:hypothetical protein